MDFIQEKTSKLELFFDQIIACEVYLRLDKNNEKENKINPEKRNVTNDLTIGKKSESIDKYRELV